MKTLLILSMLALPTGLKPTIQLDQLWGNWQLFGVIYEGEEMEPINPDQITQFEFKSPKTLIYRYWQDGDRQSCERAALFQVGRLKSNGSQIIYQRVVWAHPRNGEYCADDPNMQLGNESWSPIEVKGEELQITLPLGEEVIIYRLERVEEQAKRKTIME